MPHIKYFNLELLGRCLNNAAMAASSVCSSPRSYLTCLVYIYEFRLSREFHQYHQSGHVASIQRVPKEERIEFVRNIFPIILSPTWLRGPAMVNAFYSPPNNQICFPAGILQSPFYDSSVPNYLNYGGIGSVIGHEITHGFDDRGRLYDKNGVFHSDDSEGIWTLKTIENYKKKVQCMIDQYNNYTATQVNRSLNGFRTQGENIADNGGIKQAYRAYQKWAAKHGPEPLLPGLSYNQNQLFFINFGQVWCGKFRNQSLVSRILNGEHSPGEFRVIGSTSNFAEFGKVFNCKLGSKNNPAKKCSVW